MTPVGAPVFLITAISLYLIQSVNIANDTASVALLLAHTPAPIITHTTTISSIITTAVATVSALDVAVLTASSAALTGAGRAH